MRKTITIHAVIALMLCVGNIANAQSVTAKKIAPSVWEGMAVAGFVDHGAYLNFGGPGIKITHKPISFMFNMLPSLRFKEDKVAAGAKKNALATPTLGAGLGFVYKHLVLQLPFYYNPKNATNNGKWNMGAGIGCKF